MSDARERTPSSAFDRTHSGRGSMPLTGGRKTGLARGGVKGWPTVAVTPRPPLLTPGGDN